MSDSYEIIAYYRSAKSCECSDGCKGVDGLEQVAMDLGYTDLAELLADDSHLVEALWEAIRQNVDSDSEWADKLHDIAEQCDDHDEDDEEDYDHDEDDEDDDNVDNWD